MTTLPIWLSTNDNNPNPTAPSPAHNNSDPLDAYSRIVVSVVELATPAVLALRGPRDREDQSRGGSGSGFLITSDGLAITNSHVVGGRPSLTATTSDGDTLDAEVIGDDPATDIAIVRLAARDLPSIKIAEEPPPRVGQLVVAVGSPFGLESTVSAGIVSATNRSMRGIGGRLIDGVIQHTAPINPGNSGGPLLDSRGHVIGLNTAAIAYAQGVGFAVPAPTLRWIAGELIAHGKVARPTLGIEAANIQIPRRLVRALDLLDDHAVLIRAVQPDTPASRADLREGDVITDFDGRVVTGADDLHRFLSRVKPGATVTLTVIRDESLIRVPITPSPR